MNNQVILLIAAYVFGTASFLISLIKHHHDDHSNQTGNDFGAEPMGRTTPANDSETD